MVIATLVPSFDGRNYQMGKTLETKVPPEQAADAAQAGISTSEVEHASIIESIAKNSLKNPLTLKQFRSWVNAGIPKDLMRNIQHLNLDEIGDAVLSRDGFLAPHLMGWVTDEELTKILSYVPQLETLCLGGQRLISNAWFAIIAELVPSLKVLTLSNHKNITDAGLASLKELPLECLCLGEATASQITDVGLRYIAEIPSLQMFQIKKCHNITDSGVHALRAKPLITLDCSGCHSLTWCFV